MSNRWSLILFIHMFCVMVALLAPESTSELAVRLTRVLGPYLRLINLQSPAVSGLHLTHAMDYEDDHQIVIQLSDQPEPQVWPDDRPDRTDLLGFRRQRYLDFTKKLGQFAATENDQAAAELSRAIGTSVFLETKATRLVISCRRLAPTELDTSAPASEPYQEVYAADVWLDSDGYVRVHKRVGAGEAAPVIPAPSAAADPPPTAS